MWCPNAAIGFDTSWTLEFKDHNCWIILAWMYYISDIVCMKYKNIKECIKMYALATAYDSSLWINVRIFV